MRPEWVVSLPGCVVCGGSSGSHPATERAFCPPVCSAPQERNLLSVAYKNVVGARRASWRVLSSIESKEKEKGDHEKVTLITSYREKVEKELEKICKELLDVLERFLLPEDKTAEGQVFYWKMAGDYWRYLAEFAAAEDRKGKAEKAKEKYEQVRSRRGPGLMQGAGPVAWACC